MSSPTGSLPRTRNHGYAALAREDVPDAKRGRPDVELGDYAANHGLEVFRGAMAAGFRAALPVFEEYRFNVLRGLLPGGCYGLMFHELMEVPHRGSASMSGSLFGVHARTPGRWRLRDLLPDRSDVPFIGELSAISRTRAREPRRRPRSAPKASGSRARSRRPTCPRRRYRFTSCASTGATTMPPTTSPTTAGSTTSGCRAGTCARTRSHRTGCWRACWRDRFATCFAAGRTASSNCSSYAER